MEAQLRCRCTMDKVPSKGGYLFCPHCDTNLCPYCNSRQSHKCDYDKMYIENKGDLD